MLPKHSPARVGIDRFAQIEKPRQNATGVRFDDRNRLIKSKAGHCVRGVFPNSGKLSHLLDSLWEVSAMSIHNRFCCGAEISRASVVAEALPRAKHLIFRSARQGGEIGKRAQPLVIIRDDGGDLRLLEHELGDEDCVRVARAAPREITAVATMPIGECTPKSDYWTRHRSTQINTDETQIRTSSAIQLEKSMLVCVHLWLSHRPNFVVAC